MGQSAAAYIMKPDCQGHQSGRWTARAGLASAVQEAVAKPGTGHPASAKLEVVLGVLVSIVLLMGIAAMATGCSSGIWERRTSFEESVTSGVFINANQGWAVSGGQLFETQDGGHEWQLNTGAIRGDLCAGSPARADQARDFDLLGSLGQGMYATVSAGDDSAQKRWGLLLSRDKGRTWTTTLSFASETWIDEVAWGDQDHGWVVASSPKGDELQTILLQTSDGGATWRRQTTLPQLDESFRPPQLAFVDSLQGWALCSSRVYGTADGGKHWELRAEGIYAEDLKLLDPGLLYAFEGEQTGEDDYRGGLSYSTDGGSAWQSELPVQANSDDVALEPVWSALYASKTTGWAADEDGVAMTTDGGATWRRDQSFSGNSVYGCTFCRAGDEVIAFLERADETEVFVRPLSASD